MRGILIFLLSMSLCLLGAKKFISEYTYHAGEMDSKVTSRTFATEQVKKQVLQQIGTFVSTEIQNISTETNGVLSEMTSSEISVIAAGVVSFTILEETWNGSEYWINAQVEADPDDVIKALDALVSKKEEVQKLKDVQAKADEALLEAENLRLELRKAKDEIEKVKLQNSYNTTSNTVAAKEWFEKARASVKADKLDDAMLQYTKATELDPQMAMAYYGMANISEYRKDMDKALEYYQKAADAKSTSCFTYSGLGYIYLDRKNYPKAAESFRKACELAPHNTFFYYGLATALYSMDNKTEALENLDKALSNAWGGYPEANFFKAYIYQESQEWDKAIAEYEVNINSSDTKVKATAYAGLGYVWNARHNEPKAMEFYQKALELDPLAGPAVLNLSWLYYQNKRYNDAISCLATFLKANPNDINANILIGDVYSESGDQDKCISYNNHVLSIEPQNKYSYNNIGLAYFRKNDVPKALSNLNKALEIDKLYGEALYNLGLVYEKTGDRNQSVKSLKAAAQQNHVKAQDKLKGMGTTW